MRIAALLALLGASLPQEPPTSELVSEFLKGSAPAREALLKRGPDALLHLLEARRLKPDRPRATELNDLIFDLQEAAAVERGKAAFRKLREARVTVDMQNAPLAAVLDYLREISEIDIVVDPAARPEKDLTLTLADVPLKDVLRAACARSGLDYDFRHGVLFIAPHERLWAAPREGPVAPLSAERAAEARKWMATLSAESVVERETATAGLRKLGPAVIPALEEGARGGDAETAARCRTLAEELRPKPRTWGAIPPAGHWRGRKLEGVDLRIADKMQRMRIDLSFDDTEIAEILDFVHEFSELKMVFEDPLPKKRITFKIKDATLGETLELITLPHGLDVRVEDGQVTIFERKK